eukprot:5267938-Pyramimonas_sp.AAC.1
MGEESIFLDMRSYDELRGCTAAYSRGRAPLGLAGRSPRHDDYTLNVQQPETTRKRRVRDA